MRRFGLAALLGGVLFPPASAYLRCEEFDCFEDMVLLEGSRHRLLQQCYHGIYAGEADVASFCGDACAQLHCKRRDSIYIERTQFRPVCECLIERHKEQSNCDSMPCYKDFVAMSNNSIETFRINCKKYPSYFSSEEGVIVSKDHFPTPPTCGTPVQNGDAYMFHHGEYHPVCDCLNSRLAAYWPWSDYVISRQDNYRLITLNVFLHVILSSKTAFEEYATAEFVQELAQAVFAQIVAPFNHTLIKFNVITTEVVVNNIWASGYDNENMRRGLHLGDSRDLNFYLISDIGPYGARAAPLEAKKGIYCTPPPESLLWEIENIGDVALDGCIFSVPSEAAMNRTSLEVQRWMGACDYGPGSCRTQITPLQISNIHHRLAKTRMVPLDRIARGAHSHIKGEDLRKDPCSNLPCHRELHHIVKGQKPLQTHCRWFEDIEPIEAPEGPGLRSHVPGMWFENVDLPWWPNNCPHPVQDRLKIPWPTHQNICDCVLGNSRQSPRHTAAINIIKDVDNEIPILVDVFIHVIASSNDSIMAAKEIFNFYRLANITFIIKAVDLIVNSDWAAGQDHNQMRQVAYMGTSRDLNLFYIDTDTLDGSARSPSSPIVMCSYPFTSWWARLTKTEPEHDGCLIARNASRNPSRDPASTLRRPTPPKAVLSHII
ncbi:hypothetical protein CDD82_1199 [Ophiocordyceps australis]|uniref:Extracellular membrane protein CFEM domain-containing protein n=1 Tax=Ophiocordyceps australis TaxID=1399860 RepID=A0A2C5XCU5_9HYPO|nr:hypothetical protein CDD82_1199 [Ophiocordyceps australis]